MKHNYFILAAIAFVIGLAFAGCKKQEQEALTPKITNDKVETTSTTATFTWTVDWPGKLISVVEVSKNEDMSHSQFYGSEDETENHNFTVTVTDLEEVTKYYYRHVVWNHFYVDNKFVMEVKSFTTKTDVPKVKTVEVTDVTRTTATVIGEVTDECGSEVTERGVCWGTSHNPMTSGSHLNSGIGIGSYSIAISNLEVGKTYYVRAYAKNSNGTAYGEEMDFVTGDAVKPTVTTAEVTNIDWRTALGGGEVTDDGDATVTERGICWSTSHNPEVSGNHVNNGTGTGSYTVDMTGLTAGATYYVRAYAKNIAGLSYGNEVSFAAKAPELPIVSTNTVTDISYTTAKGRGNVTSDGGAEVIERGICWGTSHNPNIGNGFSHLAASTVGTGEFVVDMDGLNAGTIYYVRAYAKNSVGVDYGEEKSFETTAFQKPIVSTSTVTDIDYQAATCGGNVINDGGLTVTERGICWGTSHNPDLSNGFSHLAASSAGTGSFTCSLTGLNPNTKYYVRAYATNSKGTSYGDEKDFTTQALQKPTVTTSQVTDVTQTTATGGGNVTSDGGDPVTERGIYFGTSPNPAATGTKLVASSAGTGSFTCTMTGLVEGTTYYVCAYATNSLGIGYGTEVNFMTNPDQTFTVNGVSFTMKRVEGGTFWMGAQSTNPNGQNYDSEAYVSESPVHSVTLSTFYMGETEVTQELWQAVMGSNPSYFFGTNLPVERVSWNMIVNEFLPALNAATGQNFRLPTEAEWEYAARGGNQGHGYKYAGSNTIGSVAWYYDNSNSQTHSVATKSPNELGLYDMSGNVYEWCSDWYSNYSSGSQTNPQGPSSGSYRVLRGGSWGDNARHCRVSPRTNSYPDYSSYIIGFRLALPQ